MRILVTGSDGLVGRNILPVLEQEFEIVRAVESEWDISDRTRGSEVIDAVSPDVLLNLAAMTDVDGCEDKADLAFRVNADSPGILADLCAARGIGMVHFSTDYVFDGLKDLPYKEDDQTGPVSVYGKSKRLGEEKVTAVHPAALIVRTEWIYGDGGESFITKVVRAARERGGVEVVNDQTGTPTYAKDLAQPVATLIKGRRSGIYHVTSEGFCTWYGFASRTFSLLGLSVSCKPISSDRSTRKARRPSYSVLDCSKMNAHTGIRMRSWQDALEEYLKRNEGNILFRRPSTQ